MLASLALVAVLWSADGAASAAPASVPIEPITPLEPLDNGLDQPVVAHPYLYTLLETALGIGAGTVWYLRHGSDERWGRAMEWTSWRRKLFTTDEITFDGDHFNTNTVGHPFDGTAYYQIARGNGLSPAGAFVSAFIASTFWEYFVEIPENPSLNDLIITPTAGAVIGEATYRLGRYLAQSGPGVARCGGALLFAPVATLNEAPLCHRRPGCCRRHGSVWRRASAASSSTGTRRGTRLPSGSAPTSSRRASTSGRATATSRWRPASGCH